MRKQLGVFLAVAIFGVAVASCPPPNAPGDPPCANVGVPNPPGGGYVADGDFVEWRCCNQNYVCVGCTSNPGQQFFKKSAEYENSSNSPATFCFDGNNPTNVYPTPALCCACLPPGS